MRLDNFVDTTFLGALHSGDLHVLVDGVKHAFTLGEHTSLLMATRTAQSVVLVVDDVSPQACMLETPRGFLQTTLL